MTKQFLMETLEPCSCLAVFYKTLPSPPFPFFTQKHSSIVCKHRTLIESQVQLLLERFHPGINQLHLLLQKASSELIILKSSRLPNTFHVAVARLTYYYSKSHPSETRHHDYMASNLLASITGFLCDDEKETWWWWWW